MKQRIGEIASFFRWGSLLAFFLLTAGFGQDTVELSAQRFKEGVPITITAAERTAGATMLTFQDSAGYELAPLSVRSGDRQLWLREGRRNEALTDVINWYYDGETRRLVVLLDGISDDAGLDVTLSVLKSRRPGHVITVARAASAAALNDGGTLIKNIRIDIN